jgi:hypothetical protein
MNNKIDMLEKQSQLSEIFENKECSVISDGVYNESPGNSSVYSLCSPISIDFINERISDFVLLGGEKRSLNLSDFKIGLNIVIIDGTEIDEEGLHVHLSHLIAIVFDGSGVLEWETKTGQRKKNLAKKGDLVIIPRGVMHYFTGKLSFAGIEISDIIDYQKHHYSSIE